MTYPGERAAHDQQHAAYRDLVSHIGEHVRQALAGGAAPDDVACQLGAELAASGYKRRQLAHLLGVALVELEVAPLRRNR
jgi:hypothetical protein